MNNIESQPTHCEVLVVGAGPVGLSAALALRSRGRAVTLLEAEPEDRNRAGSRAIFVHRASLQLLEHMHPGLGRDIVAHGLVWPTKRTFWRGREVFVHHYPPPNPNALPPFTSLPQAQTEQYLLGACKAVGVTFVWNAPVTGIETTPDGVTVTTKSGQTWTTDYLIGADGSRSAVRHALGVPMEGSSSRNSYVVVDVAEDLDDPLDNERVFHYEHPAVGRRNVLFVPFIGGWRIDLQCHEDDDPDEFSGLQGVRRWLPEVMLPRYADRVTWVSTYQFRQVVAQNFTDQHHRALLVGEAAHLFAPFGARGMNSGIADAVAAAAAIDDALNATNQSEAREAIERFSRSRRAAAEYNRMAVEQALAQLQPHDPATWAKRHLAAMLAPYWRRAGAWLDEAPYGPRSGPPGQTSGKY